ncbi:hypothetical protein GGR28_001801 [Lewinella aquimaris]|uniref:Uncharacterized protein n=1 Tax=Neolewinella aquimaris TaxID=1835722 RepID=A0A840E1T4_9BACT|nr:hypothetical protein [Neolewinella aquimaris]
MNFNHLLCLLLFFLCFDSSEIVAQHVQPPVAAPMCSEITPADAEEAATCTGAANCKACKNCKYCKHCSQKNKSCGLCKRTAATEVPEPHSGLPAVVADQPRQ